MSNSPYSPNASASPELTEKLPAGVGEEVGCLEHPALVLIHPPMEGIGEARPIESEICVVGRDSSADFCVPRKSISRRHAELRRNFDGEWLLADMGSTNGTLLNDEEVDDAVLEDGDYIQFGDAIFRFVSEDSARYCKRVYALTNLDGLSTAYNAQYFSSHLERVMSRKKGGDISLLEMDIDWYSDINEERGELCGDSVLKQLTRFVHLHLSEGQIFARIHGGQFALSMPDAELEEALQFATRLCAQIASHEFVFEGESFNLSVSIGVAASAQGELAPEKLMEEAEKQMVAAKERGRSCVAP